ncbi:MAG: NAD(P)-dependent oxidoreductase [Promethearchaeia archaeon]
MVNGHGNSYFTAEGLADTKGMNLIFPGSSDEKDYIEYAPDVDIIVGWRPSENLLEHAQKLRLYINPGAGVQHLLVKFRSLDPSRDVTLVNGHGNSYFTAQHAVALLLALTNKVIPHHNWMTEGKWRTGDEQARSTPMRERHVGLLGYGAVNSKVHRFLSGFMLDFSVLKTSWEEEGNLPTPITRYTPPNLHEFLEAIDTLIIAVPLTDKTKGLIAEEQLKLLGEEGFLVNMSRGDIVDEDALYRALENDVIKGACIDVWYEYRPEPDEKDRKFPYDEEHHPFHNLENIVLSPHRGASPMNDLKRWDEVTENIRRFAEGNTDFLNMVDIERGY